MGLLIATLVVVGGLGALVCRTCAINPLLVVLLGCLLVWGISGGGPGGPPTRPA